MDDIVSRAVCYEDGVVRIVPCDMRDIEPIHAAVIESLDDLIPYMTWCHAGYSREETTNYLELCEMAWHNGSEFQFKIADANDGAVLGLCGINHINVILRFGNLGYWVRTSRTGKGLATRASLLAARFAFEILGLNRVEIVVDPANKASLRVAEKTGARREGILRNRIVVHDMPFDAVMFSLIPGDLD